MTRQEIIEHLEYLSGGINAVLTIVRNGEHKEWDELLDTWATIVESVTNALEEEAHNATYH